MLSFVAPVCPGLLLVRFFKLRWTRRIACCDASGARNAAVPVCQGAEGQRLLGKPARSGYHRLQTASSFIKQRH